MVCRYKRRFIFTFILPINFFDVEFNFPYFRVYPFFYTVYFRVYQFLGIFSVRTMTLFSLSFAQSHFR